jgi:hypothetical protein
MNKILYIKWGGLGDHLQFSTLPELFSKNGYDVYISDKSEYRDRTHYDLIWGNNPYVKGITSEEANCGHIENWGIPLNNIVEFNPGISIHRNIENLYGVDSYSNYPKIYYNPDNLNEYNDCIFLDLNAASVANYSHNTNVILNHIQSFKDQKVIYALSENSYGKSVIDINLLNSFGFQPIKTNGIFNYTNLIYSSKRFVCLWSGGAHLATAIKQSYKPELQIDCLKADSGMHGWGTTNKSFFWYDCVNYIYC